MNPADPLSLFLPPVQQWFRKALGEPTAPQLLGWPAIRAGQHTLILAPTGSGKTLAAFLACLDGLWRQEPAPRGVQVLYISPLKALNNDIARNLQAPLMGVNEEAAALGYALPTIEVGVRTGDTPASERQRLVRRPPQILITTPESLHLLLTSRARESLRTVTHCIVDEIHALCPNKRGVFLSLLLERLEELAARPFIRIGLSATQRPLEEVGRFLGGLAPAPDGTLQPRPVTIIDAGLRKDLDLRVVSPADPLGPLPEKSVWPAIYRFLGEEIGRHRSTIIFANNRRTVERITAQLNDTEDLARAHHGSVALEVRQATEQALKEGRLPAVVATASLELGIDMGTVDLVCQVESPGSVARGLQRVGRAGHLVGQKSKGRLIAKLPADLLEEAVLAHEMAAGRVEELRVPPNCLDVLAQQVVAMTAVEDRDVPALFQRVRQAYPYRQLSPQAFEAVLEMISGRFRFVPQEVDNSGDLSDPAARGLSMGALQPRISWDRTHNRLHALPGTLALALVSGGVIPDTGQYPVYLANGVRLGELDEEFVYERRVGEAFLLGTNTWRIEQIESDRVLVTPAEGAPAVVPFWRGEQAGRSLDLGLALGNFLRELRDKLQRPDCLDWLTREYFLEPAGARNLLGYVRRQLLAAGCLPTDRTIVIEAVRDPLGDWQVILLSPLGHKFHFALRLALEAHLGKRLGYKPQCLHHNNGLLLRLADTDEPLLDLFDGLTPENVEGLLLEVLADSALFALRFRQNAARALLLPRTAPGKRAPLWLQRLRSRDLLQVARRHPDFPMVAETVRECLHDHLDLPILRQVLGDIHTGSIEVVTRRAESPSPFASGLLFAFTAASMYQYDSVPTESARAAALDADFLNQLNAPERQDHLLDPRAIAQVERRLRGLGRPPRSPAEMFEWLRRLGDLASGDLEGPMLPFLEELETEGRVRKLNLPGSAEANGSGQRWIVAEELGLYRQAFGLEPAEPEQAQAAGRAILRRFLETHALVCLQDILDRYPFERGWAQRQLEDWTQAGRLVHIQQPEAATVQWSAPTNLEQMQRGSLALLRRAVLTCPPTQFVDFVIRWQGLHPEIRRGGADGLAGTLGRLQGLALPAALWEQALFPARIPEYQPRWLDEAIASGEWVWTCRSEGAAGAGALAFWHRDHLGDLPAPVLDAVAPLDHSAERVLEHLQARGASFVADISQATGLLPSAIRMALWALLRRGLVTNDQFQVIRKGEEECGPVAGGGPSHAGPALLSRCRRASLRQPEGRWSLVSWGRPDPEMQAVLLAEILLERYGVAARELAMLDAAMLPWRILYEVLSRMELAGEVRRGYFVEGLSGAQFALPDAARQLQELALPSTAAAPVILVHSLDPANLYGTGAPLDVPLLDGGTRPFTRRLGNWLVLRAGRPVLLVEQQGKRLTALPTAGQEEVSAAVGCLPAILAADRGLSSRRRLVVAEWNGQTITASAGRELLEAAGFVRDYQEMVLYGTWR